MIKIVVTDYTFDSLDIETEILEPLGCGIVAGQCKTPAELIPVVADADYVITTFAPITAEVIDAMQTTKVIVRYGIGVDNVDVEAARAKGISVCNVPDYCLDEVADHTLGFILSATRSLVANHNHVLGGKWGMAVPRDRMQALQEMTVGIVGFGRIGQEVAKRLGPFKCERLVHDPFVESAKIEKSGCTSVSWDRLLAESDLVTLHCPSTPETRGLINQETIARMKPGAILVNVGRGSLVETPALVEALKQGQLGFAALDVFDLEPVPAESPLRSMENVLMTSHIASCSISAERRSRESAAKTIVKSIQGRPLPNVVNGVGAN